MTEPRIGATELLVAGSVDGTPAAPELDRLVALANEAAATAAGRPEERVAAKLSERLRSRRLVIAVVGEFKRGKSTLLNALLGEKVVPTGVLPLTAVATELSFGDPSTVVEHLDGSLEVIDIGQIADFVTEELNPGNYKQVAKVTIRGRWPLLAGGIVLMDTPGTASAFEHNSEAARMALLDADGAVVVFSADSPFSASELEMLRVLRERRAPTFFVLNKVDHLAHEELAQVQRFVARMLRERLGRDPRVFSIDARSALQCRTEGRADAPFDFAELVAEIERFISEDLVGALVTSARRELSSIGRSLLEALDLEDAALEMDAATMSRVSESFHQAAAEHRRSFEEDRVLLRHDVDDLVRNIRNKLDEFARLQPPRYYAVLEQAAREAGAAELDVKLRDAIEKSVRESFESFRITEAAQADKEWQALAEAFRHRTEQRIAAIRAAASDLFTVRLPAIGIPPVADERERFFYLFLQVGSSTDLFTSAAARLVPRRLVLPRALRKAKEELGAEFIKHAGRAGWDLEQRLREAEHKLERAMEAEIDLRTQAILDAAARADERRKAADAEKTRRKDDSTILRHLASRMAALFPEEPAEPAAFSTPRSSADES